MNKIDFVYYRFNNGYNYITIYRRNVTSGELHYWDKKSRNFFMESSYNNLSLLLNMGNGKRTLEQITEWSFLPESEIRQKMEIIEFTNELIL